MICKCVLPDLDFGTCASSTAYCILKSCFAALGLDLSTLKGFSALDTIGRAASCHKKMDNRY